MFIDENKWKTKINEKYEIWKVTTAVDWIQYVTIILYYYWVNIVLYEILHVTKS